MFYEWAHILLRAAYAVIPIFYSAILLDRWYRLRQKKALGGLISTAVAALVLGGGMATIFAGAVGARVRVDQVLLAGLYFFSLLVVLKGLDKLAMAAGRRAFGVRDEIDSPMSRSGGNRITGFLDETPAHNPPRGRRVGVGVIRVAVLIGVGLPYVMAAAMVYRPKVGLAGDPMTEMRWPFEPVTLSATDGERISAWWIPAARPPAGAPAEWGTRTAVICHGLGANKLNQLLLGRIADARGYNLLAIDFRAHGASGGQFSTFGDHERRDVLGALRWLARNRPEQSRKIIGIGASLGAAAMIAAAGDDSPEGRSLSGLVVYATYADFGALATDVSRERFPPVMGPLARWVAVPLASIHAGADLAAFRPADAVKRLAGRPMAIIHGRRDEIIPPSHAEALIAAHPGPRKLILLESDHNGIVEDDRAGTEAINFVEEGPAKDGGPVQ